MEENKKNYGYVLIGADLSVTLKEKDDKTFKEGELAEAIESEYIQVISIKGGKCLVIDEEGKLNHLPYNLIATALWGVDYDFIVGAAALCVIENDSVCALPMEEARKLHEFINLILSL